MGVQRYAYFIVSVFLIVGCATAPRTDKSIPAAAAGTRLFDPATAIQDQWQHLRLQGETEYRLALMDGQVAIRAIGQQSASGLIRRVSIDPTKCPIVEWSWSVTKMQQDANLRVKEKEDVAASIFLLFGDPGFSLAPNPVPTLRYVWSSHLIEGEQAEIGEVIDSPYMPGIVKSIVVEQGLPDRPGWTLERRNIRDDFERAFGRPPDAPVQAIALFSDNDQTREPVEAYYGWARALCKAGGVDPDAAYSWD